jgi:hypothetical protein
MCKIRLHNSRIDLHTLCLSFIVDHSAPYCTRTYFLKHNLFIFPLNLLTHNKNKGYSQETEHRAVYRIESCNIVILLR